MKGHIVTSEVQTELSVQVVLPNGELKTLRVLVDFGCQAVALANPNVFGEQISEKYESPQRRRLLQADNETPLPGGDEQIDVKIQFTGVVDGSVPLPRVAQYGVSPYLVPNLPWDVVLGHPWGYEHCVSHFARFNCLYSHHPVHPRFWIEDFREVPRTGKPFLVKPIHGKVSRKSVWGVTVLIIGAGAPLPPAPAIVVTPPDGEPPNRVEAEKYISYALTASSVAPVQDRACALELVEFAPEKLARDVLPTRRDGTAWKQSDYGLTPYWAGRVKKQFGKNPDVDAFNRVPGIAQATRWVSPQDDFFSTPADPSKLYWMCPPYHRFSDCVRKIRQEKLRAIVVGPKWTHREWWKPLMEVTLQGYHLPGPETKARLYQDDNLTPLAQREWSTVALYVDGGLADENLRATKCHVASVLAPAVPNPDTDNEPGMTSEEESEDERVPNHLVSVRSLTYQATHKKLLAPVTLDPTPEDLEAQECVRSRIAKIERELLSGGATTVKRYRKTNGATKLLAASRVGGMVAAQEPIVSPEVELMRKKILADYERDVFSGEVPHAAHPSQEWRGTSGARRTPQPGVAGYKRSAHTNTHTPQHPSQEWRGAAETQAKAHTPTPHTPAKSGRVQAERAREHTHTPTPQPGVAGRSRNPSQSTHTHAAHPSQEWRGTSGAGARAHTHPNTPARSGGAQPKPKPKHTHPRRTPQPGVAGYKRSGRASTHTPQHPSQEWRGAAETQAKAHTPTPHTQARSGGVQAERAHEHTHTSTPQPGVAGRSRNPSISTHTHAANPSQEWRGTSGARRTPQPGVAGYKRSAHTNTHTPQHPSQEWRGTAETQAKAHTPTPHTPARSGGVQAERAHKHTHTPTPQPGVAGRSRNPSQSTHTHAAHPSQEWRGTSGAGARAHTHPNTPARSGGAQPKPKPKHTHPRRTPQPGVAGYKRSGRTSTHTPQHPSQEWRGAAETQAKAHTPTRHTPARSGGVQAERAAHPSQEWRGTSGGRTRTRTHPNTPARSGGAQPKPKPKHTHPRRTPQPGVAGYKRSGRTSTHTPQHPSQEWRGAAETQAKAHTPTPHTPARSGGVQAERAHEHTHTPTPQPGVAGRSRNPSQSTHTQAAHPSQEWRGTSGAGARAHTHLNTPARSGGAQPKPKHKHTHPRGTPQPGVAGYKRSAPHTPARSGGVQAEGAHEHAHTPTPQPGVAGHSRNPSQSTHTHAAHPSQEWRGTSGAGARAHTHPNTPARSGGAQPKPKPKHTHPRRTPQPGVAGYKRSGRTSTHTPQHPSQEWRGAAETQAKAHTPTPHTPARSGGVQAERAHEHTHTSTPQPGVAGRSRNPSQSTHTHAAHPSQEWRGTSGARRTPQPGVAGYKRRAHTNTHTPQHPSQEWRGAAETQAKAHTPTPHTPARSGGVQAERAHEHTHTPTPQPGVAGRSRNPSQSTHTHAAQPSQEWRGTSGAGARAHTHPNTPARSGGAQPKPKPKHTHPRRTPQPGVAGYKRSGRTSTHTPQHPNQEWRGAAETQAKAHTPTPHTPARSGGVQAERAAHPSQEWRGTSGARTRTRTHPNTPARSGGAQPKPKPKHTHPRRTPQPGVAGYKRSGRTSTHTPQHPSQEWRGAAETQAKAHTPTPHTPARSGGVQAERAAHPSQEWWGTSGLHTRTHKHPNTPARSGGAQPKPKPKHTHPRRTPQPGVAGYKRSGRTSTHTPQHPSQEWRGAAETQAKAHTPTPHTPARSGGVQAERAAHPSQEWRGTSGAGTRTRTHPNTPARSGGAQPKPEPKHTHPHRTPQPGVAGYKRSGHTNTHPPQHPSQEWRGAAETRAQTQPGPTHKHHTTVGNPVSIARALRQPVPCR